MGGQAEGWKLRRQRNSPFWFVRFRHKRRRYEKSTGKKDKGEARARAAEIYADVVSGRVALTVGADPTGDKLIDALTQWLDVYADEHKPRTTETVTGYAEAHWIPFFRSASRFTTPMIDAYRRARLGKATRSTVRKELSGLRRFSEWWAENAGPRVDVPSLPKHGLPGKRAKNARKPKALVLTPEQVELVLGELPERNKLGKPVRDLFRVLWETALRESTVYALEVPTHFKCGARELLITREIDKTAESGERRLDITDACSKALTRLAPSSGLIFKRIQLRYPLRRACVAADVPVVSPYDLRHSRLSAWANAGGPLAGVQYLAGHASISTTARYIHASRDAAKAVLGWKKKRKSA